MQKLSVSILDEGVNGPSVSLDNTKIEICTVLHVNNTSRTRLHTVTLTLLIPEVDVVCSWMGRKVRVVQKTQTSDVYVIDLQTGKKIRGIAGYTLTLSLIDQITLSLYFCPVVFAQGQYAVADDEIRPDQLGIDVVNMLIPEDWQKTKGAQGA